MPIYKTDKKTKDGVFKYGVRINYVDSYSNNKQLTRIANGLQAAKALERNLMGELDAETLTATITLNKLFNKQIEALENELRQSSLNKKKSNYSIHIAPTLGNKKVSDLDVRILQNWKNNLNKTDLSLTSKRNIYSELRSILNFGVKMEFLPKNPISKIDNFSDSYHEDKQVDFYTPEEFKIYKAAALEIAQQTNYYDYYVFFCIAYYSGARKGEIHALRWNCYNGSTLSIKKSISQKIKGGDVETPPKNKSSVRNVLIPQPLINILETHKKRQQQIFPNWTDTAFICGYIKPLRDTSIDNMNRKISTSVNLKHIRIHDFRHSHASLLINNNINPSEIAHRLGHSTVEQTLKTYSNLFLSKE